MSMESDEQFYNAPKDDSDLPFLKNYGDKDLEEVRDILDERVKAFESKEEKHRTRDDYAEYLSNFHELELIEKKIKNLKENSFKTMDEKKDIKLGDMGLN